MAGKADIVDRVASSVDGLTKKQAGEILDSTLAAIRSHLKRGERVQLPGFGSFSVARRAAREGRNPATGEAMIIKASRNVRFKAGKELREAVNKGRG